jgi:hypothetical protein
MITVRPYDDMTALPVFQHLDPMDQIEAELVRGSASAAVQLWADWRAVQPYRFLSFVALTAGQTPFAVFGLSHTGQSGVAGAALLARDHGRYRRELVQLARKIRDGMADQARARGVHRIEARCWVDHPRAAGLLRALGFAHECDLPGFGLSGQVVYRQFAWLAPEVTPLSACAPDHPEPQRT